MCVTYVTMCILRVSQRYNTNKSEVVVWEEVVEEVVAVAEVAAVVEEAPEVQEVIDIVGIQGQVEEVPAVIPPIAEAVVADTIIMVEVTTVAEVIIADLCLCRTL